MEIVLIRHAQPDWLHGEDYTLDPGLTSLGREQAKLSSSSLGGQFFEEIWSSDLRRAKETLDPFGGVLKDVPVSIFPWLREMSDEKEKSLFGKSQEEISNYFIERNTRPFNEWINNYHGEYFTEYSANIICNLEKELETRGVSIVSSEIDKVFSIKNDGVVRDPAINVNAIDTTSGRRGVLIVSHAGTMSVLLSYFLNIPLYPWTWRKYLPVHGAHTSLRSTKTEGGHIFRLKKFNDTSFYGREDLTTY